MMHSIRKPILITKERNGLADDEVERMAALALVADGLHAHLGQPLANGAGVFQTGFVLYLENHRVACRARIAVNNSKRIAAESPCWPDRSASTSLQGTR